MTLLVGWDIAPTGMDDVGDYRILTAPRGQSAGGLVPRALMAGMAYPDPAAAKREMEAMMTMRKIDIPKVGAARAGGTTDA